MNLQQHFYNTRNFTTHIDICTNTSVFYLFYTTITDYPRVHNWRLKYIEEILLTTQPDDIC